MPRNRRFRGKRNLKTMVNKMIDNKLDDNIENKTYTYGVRELSIDTTGFIRQVLEVNQGTADAQRVGDKIKVQHIEVNLTFLAGDVSNFVRFIMFRDMAQTPGAIAPNVVAAQNAVLQEVGDNGYSWSATGAVAYAPTQFENKHRYQILLDEKIPMIASGSSGQVNYSRFLRRNMNIDFFGLTGPNGLSKGALYCLFISNSGIGPHVQCDGYIRTVFQDA